MQQQLPLLSTQFFFTDSGVDIGAGIGVDISIGMGADMGVDISASIYINKSADKGVDIDAGTAVVIDDGISAIISIDNTVVPTLTPALIPTSVFDAYLNATKSMSILTSTLTARDSNPYLLTSPSCLGTQAYKGLDFEYCGRPLSSLDFISSEICQ
ncbi:hypothetical protein L7F22_026601 [Adiantum nelumboides]|nr:hypothetical protein [Adiantum nelumboides]